MPDTTTSPHRPNFWNNHQPSFFATVGKQLVSFLFGALVAAFVFGGKYQKLDDMLVWKGATDTEMKRIAEQSTDNKYKIEAGVTAVVLYESRLKEAEKQTAKMDTVLLKIEGLEKSVAELKAQPRK